MAYGTVKVDNITFTNGGIDQTVTVSGIVQSISGNITATGTIQGATIIGTSTVSGATVTGNAGVFTTVTGGSAGFTTVTGTTVTGTTANFATISGTTITGGAVTVASGIFSGNSTAAAFIPTGSTVPTNGLYLPAANSVALSTSGTGRLFVDSTGLVSIGDSGQLVIGKGESAIPANSVKAHVFWGLDSVYGGTSGDLIMIPRSSAAANFRVYTGSTTPSERFRITGTGQLSHIGAGSAISPAVSFNGIAPSNSLVITSAGLVGIGVTGPDKLVTAQGATTPGIKVKTTSSASYSTNEAVNDADDYIQLFANRSARAAFGSLDTGETALLSSKSLSIMAANSNQVIKFAAGGSTERARIDSSGRLLVGTNTSIAAPDALGNNRDGSLQLAGNLLATTMQGNHFFNVSSTGPLYQFTKSNTSTIGTHTIVALNDRLGTFQWSGSDGTNYIPAAQIYAQVDGTPAYAATALVSGQTYRIVTVGTTDFTLIGASANTVGTVFTATGPGTGTGTAILNAGNMPGRLVFSVTADGASSPTEQLRITSDRYVRLASGSGGIQFNGDTAAANALDDYEEGTFTPTLTSTNADTVIGSYQSRVGLYTKIGNLVTISIYLATNVTTAGTGNVIVTGLPFTSGAASLSALSLSAVGRWTTQGPLAAGIGANSTTIGLEETDSAVDPNLATALSTSRLTTGASTKNVMLISGFYRV